MKLFSTKQKTAYKNNKTKFKKVKRHCSYHLSSEACFLFHVVVHEYMVWKAIYLSILHATFKDEIDSLWVLHMHVKLDCIFCTQICLGKLNHFFCPKGAAIFTVTTNFLTVTKA